LSITLNQISRRTRELFPEHVNLTAGLCVTADIQQHRTVTDLYLQENEAPGAT
jgi:hypothetical protein